MKELNLKTKKQKVDFSFYTGGVSIEAWKTQYVVCTVGCIILNVAARL